VAVGDHFDGFGRAAPQRVGADDVATAHVGQQRADGGQLRADGNVDLAALNQVHVGRIVDDAHHFACAEPLGQQGGHDVGFVVVGQRKEHIGIVDVFLNQQVPIRSAALQDDGVVQ